VLVQFSVQAALPEKRVSLQKLRSLYRKSTERAPVQRDRAYRSFSHLICDMAPSKAISIDQSSIGPSDP
jgi:hypothetical protein